MTTELANEVGHRLQSLLFTHSDTMIIDYSDLSQMEGVFGGELCCVMLRRGNTLIVAYTPRCVTQWVFDAYST